MGGVRSGKWGIVNLCFIFARNIVIHFITTALAGRYLTNTFIQRHRETV